MGIDFWTGALFIVLLTGVYTVFGGLRAVLYTEVVQMVVLVAGAVAVTAIGLTKIGGWENLVATAGSDHLNLFLPADHPEFPWPAMVLAPPIVGLWYWCTDQYIVQRVLAGRETRLRLAGAPSSPRTSSSFPSSYSSSPGSSPSPWPGRGRSSWNPSIRPFPSW